MSSLSHLTTHPRFRRWQVQVFVIAWLSYASFYLCRVNIAVALPAIQADLGWDRSVVGLIGGVFLWVYAVGQLINGTLGQKANARWFVGVGMLVSAALNAAFGASSWLWLMVVLWGINGWAQSMGWGAIMKTIASWFDARRRGRITALFSPCFVLGHLTAWAAGGWLVGRLGWRYAFWLPAIVFGAMGLTWLAGIRSTPQEAGFGTRDKNPDQARVTVRQIVRSMLAHPRLRWAALTCVFASMIKDGLTLWTPTYLVDALGMSVERAALAASVLPLLGLGRSLLAGWLSDRFFRSREGPGIMGLSLVIATAMVGFVLTGNGSPWLSVILLGVCGASVYGINSLLLTSLPLSFGEGGHVGAVAGFLDFASYVGGGISALVVGQLLDWKSWTAVFLYWLAATLVAFAGAGVLSVRTREDSSR
jgi:OPA family glycerol-3-phosphate transporter-like MFS transporter